MTQIFIGGAGRSGTTILAELLGSHPQVLTFPREMRFLTDPGGLINLADALSTGYSPPQAREALRRFERLMGHDLISPATPPYIGFDLRTLFGADHYRAELQRFLAAVTAYSFEGRDYPIGGGALELAFAPLARPAERLINGLRKRLGPPGRRRRVSFSPYKTLSEGRYFADRAELTALMGGYAGSLFSRAAEMRGRASWCEHTPGNLAHMGFLWELFPDAWVIHITRDPRGVAASMRDLGWAPSDPGQLVTLLDQLFSKFAAEYERSGAAGRNYIQIKLEDLAADPEGAPGMLREKLGLEGGFANPPALSPDRVDYWRREMDKAELARLTQALEPHITRLGYDL